MLASRRLDDATGLLWYWADIVLRDASQDTLHTVAAMTDDEFWAFCSPTSARLATFSRSVATQAPWTVFNSTGSAPAPAYATHRITRL